MQGGFKILVPGRKDGTEGLPSTCEHTEVSFYNSARIWLGFMINIEKTKQTESRWLALAK